MTENTENTLAADYSLAPNELATALEQLIGEQQPTMVWGAPGVGKSAIATQVADKLGLTYVDVRALLIDPVDLRGIPWRDENDMTRWAPPTFLPPQKSDKGFLINLEELPSAVPMVQAALYQLVHDRKVGEYTLPPGAALIACGNRESDRGVVHRMPTPLASRFIHLEAQVDIDAWTDWALSAQVPMEVIFFLKFRPDLLQVFDPLSSEKAFPCPRTWEFAGNMVRAGNEGKSATDLAILRGAIGEGAAVEFAAFLGIFKVLPSPDIIFQDPLGVQIPDDPSALIALCGALCKQAEEDKMDALVSFAMRKDMRPELSEFLIGSSIKAHPKSQYTRAYVNWSSHLSKLT